MNRPKKQKQSQLFWLPIFFLILSGLLLTSQSHAKSKFNHDYSQTLVMKIGLSVPDGNGGSKVFNTFEDALQIIKTADHLSLGVPKIIYLVGWQYSGHDDRYPAFFEVNKALKRAEDKDAHTSLIWLMKEARKFNTTVSLHINMTDAYDDSPLWDEYVEKDMISKTAYGNLMVVGVYTDKKAYQINYKNEWENGYAQMRIDRLLDLLPPLKEAATIHLDAWIVRESKGHYESAVIESEYQKKILNYWNEKGLDVTSEWVMDYMVGKVPFAWHFNHLKQDDYFRIPAKVYTGSGLNPDVNGTDFGLGFLFGKSMYGENVFPSLQKTPNDKTWESKFINEFYQNCLQYFFLNNLERVKVDGEGDSRIAYFSDGVKVSLADSTVLQHDCVLRDKEFLCFPLVWKKEKCLAVYSNKSGEKAIQIPKSWGKVKQISVFEVSAKGNTFKERYEVKEGILEVSYKANIPLFITFE